MVPLVSDVDQLAALGALPPPPKRAPLLTEEQLSDLSLRDALVVNFIRGADAGAETDLIGKLLLVHNFLLDRVPLLQRCHDTIPLNGLLSLCLDVYVDDITLQLQELGHPPQSSYDVTDILDSRLFRTAAVILREFRNDDGMVTDKSMFPLDGVSKMEHLWTCAGREDGLFPIDGSQLECIGEFQPAIDKADKPRLMPIKSDLMEFLIGTKDREEYKDGQYIHTELGEDSCAGTKTMDLFFQKYGWINGAKLDKAVMEFQFIKEKEDKQRDAQIEKLQKRGFNKEQIQQKLNRTKQMGAAHVHTFAKSLTGAGHLHHAVVLEKSSHPWRGVDLAREDTKPKKEPKKVEPKKKPKSQASSGKKETFIQKNEAIVKARHHEKDVVYLKTLSDAVRRELKGVTDPVDFINAMLNVLVGRKRYVNSFDGFPGVTSVMKLPEKQLEFLLHVVERFYAKCSSFRMDYVKKTKMRSNIRQLIEHTFRLVHDIINQYLDLMTPDNFAYIYEVLYGIGFTTSANLCHQKWAAQYTPPEGDGKPKKKGKGEMDERTRALKKMEKRLKEISSQIDFCIPPGEEYDFQLLYMGPLMDRTTGAAVDPRVRFKPDRWQQELLDTVDKRGSALVCTPTSSGKTFICYYAMDKALRFDDTAKVVYLAPNKALVNQVYAETYARFKTKKYTTPNSHLAGNLTLDFNEVPLTAQCLVTFPSCLEMLLMSSDPVHRKWVSELHYVIFDEVHCIGNDDEGRQWENVLQMIPCAFMALSATVGNPNSFHRWLCDASGRDVKLITHDERYSDLALYAYSHKSSDLYSLDRLSCLSFRDVSQSSLPRDFYITPEECMRFYSALLNIIKSNSKEDYQMLKTHFSPASFFSGSRCITKRQYRMYWGTLKTMFLEYIKIGILNRTSFEVLTKELQVLKPVGITRDDFWSKTVEGVISTTAPIEAQVTEKPYLDPESAKAFIFHLQERAMLPSIFFSFSREHIVGMVKRLVTHLSHGQWNKYYGSEEAAARTRAINKQKIDEWTKMRDLKEMNDKLRGISRTQREQEGAAHDQMLDEDLPDYPTDIASDFDPQFNFANRNVLVEFTEELSKLKMKTRADDWMIEALHRGIAIHHEGLPTRYRQAVEAMFRLGYVTVVVATSSLSLGVNMPCRTVVFLGDHIELTPLYFRQMSGRAGRRGFDNLGHVIMWNIRIPRVRRLVSSLLPGLTGQYPVMASNVVRYFAKANTVTDSVPLGQTNAELTSVFNTFSRVLRYPLFMVPLENVSYDPKWKSEMVIANRVTFRIFVELLRNLGCLSRFGRVSGLYSILVSTFEEEPFNLLFVTLLASGCLHRLISETDDEYQKALKLMHVLAFCFRRHPMLPPLKNVTRPKGTNVYKPEVFPYLPKLPEDVHQQISKYNDLVFDLGVKRCCIIGAIASLASKTDDGFEDSDYRLPVSGVEARRPTTPMEGTFLETVRSRKIEASVRSPFTMLVGASDDSFTSKTELLETCRQSIYVEDAILLIAENSVIQHDPGEDTYKYNSYLIDFFIHGDLNRVVWENSIWAAKAWSEIRDFLRQLKRLRYASRTLLIPPNGPLKSTESVLDPLVHVLDQVNEIMEGHFTATNKK